MQEFQLCDYDRKLQRVFAKAKDSLSSDNLVLITRYDEEMATIGLKKSTRLKQISILIDITIRIGKNWSEVIRVDIDKLIRTVWMNLVMVWEVNLKPGLESFVQKKTKLA